MEKLTAGATALTVQKTQTGRIQFEDMVVFEAIQAKKGGGTLRAIH